MDAFYSIVSFFSTGGMFMYPILVVFAFALGQISDALYRVGGQYRRNM